MENIEEIKFSTNPYSKVIPSNSELSIQAIGPYAADDMTLLKYRHHR